MKNEPVTGKYLISHPDGSPVNPNHRYFVLNSTTDSNALIALRSYALSCQNSYPLLARSINEEYNLGLIEKKGRLIPIDR